jgi:hypothetical protein
MRDFVDRHHATIGNALRLNLQRGHAIPGDAARRLDHIASTVEHGGEWSLEARQALIGPEYFTGRTSPPLL